MRLVIWRATPGTARSPTTCSSAPRSPGTAPLGRHPHAGRRGHGSVDTCPHRGTKASLHRGRGPCAVEIHVHSVGNEIWRWGSLRTHVLVGATLAVEPRSRQRMPAQTPHVPRVELSPPRQQVLPRVRKTKMLRRSSRRLQDWEPPESAWSVPGRVIRRWTPTRRNSSIHGGLAPSSSRRRHSTWRCTRRVR